MEPRVPALVTDETALRADEAALCGHGPRITLSNKRIPLHLTRSRCVGPIALAVFAACVSGRPAMVHSTASVPRDSENVVVNGIAVAALGRSSARHVVAADIVSIHGTSVADAVLQLRPDWLRPNSSPSHSAELIRPAVYVDETYAGGPEELRFVPLTRVVELNFLASSAARDQIGPSCRCAGGVILVRTRRTW